MKTELLLTLKDQITPKLKTVRMNSMRTFKGMAYDAKKSFGQINNDFKKSSALIGSGMMSIMKGAAFAAPMVMMAKMSTDFEAGMTKIATVTDLTKEKIEKDFTSIIEDAQIKFGKNFQEVQKGLYDGFSAGVPQTQKAAKQYMDAVGVMANVGATDFATSADLLTTSLNAFGFKTEQSGEVVNRLFNIIKQGKLEIPELAQSFGQITGIAGGLQLNLSDIGAALAALTTGGFKVPGAITAMKGALQAFLKPSVEAQKTMDKLGLKLDSVTLKNEGFHGTLTRLIKTIRTRVRGESEQNRVLLRILGSQEAINGGLALTGKLTDSYNEKQETLNKNLDVTQKRMAEYSRTAAAKFASANQKLLIIGKNIGVEYKLIFSKIVDDLSPVMESFGKFIKENKNLIATIAKYSLVIPAFLIGLGLLKIAFGALGLVKVALNLTWVIGKFLILKPLIWATSFAAKILGLTFAKAFGLITIMIAGVGSWIYVFNQLSDATTSWGGDLRLLMTDLNGFMAVMNKLKGFAGYIFSGGNISADAVKAVQKVDMLRTAKGIGTSERLQETQGKGGILEKTVSNFEVNINNTFPAGVNAEESSKLTAKEFEKKMNEHDKRQKRLAFK